MIFSPGRAWCVGRHVGVILFLHLANQLADLSCHGDDEELFPLLSAVRVIILDVA